MEDMTGKTLDRYQVTALIDQGGMATVYRARQPRLKRDVAIKVMLPALAADPDFRERFDREAQAVANLRHPNILTVHDYGETEDGQLYLVVEYVEGGTLRERLERPLPLEEAVEIVAQVAEALDYAHQQGVVHRDVKPNNILLTGEGRPLLADFGLAKPIEADRALTATGMVLGTPDYVSPEQAQALEIDGRADIYALGVVLFQALTGQHPYSGESPLTVMVKHITEPMPRPSERNPAVPPALDEIVAKTTAKSPDERYQRAGELARALRAALVSGATPELGAERVTPPPPAPEPVSPLPTPGADTTPPPLPKPWRQRRTVWAALAVVLVGVLAAGAFLVLPSLSRDRETELTGAPPVAQPGEVMILIAQFKAQEGTERYDVSQRLYNKLSDDLRQLGEEDATVYQVPEVIESSEEAIALGARYGATTVIWGFYDDIGISPSIEAVGTVEASLLSVGLERFNLAAEEAVNFKLYIARDMPEEISFMTATLLFQAFIVEGRFDKAILYLSMAGDNLPDDPQFRGGGEMVFFFEAMLAFFRGDTEAAIANIDQAISINPDVAVLYSMRANFQFMVGETDGALIDFERAITLDPGDALAYSSKAYVVWAEGDLESALSAYDLVAELTPDEWLGYWMQGLIHFEMGNLTLALAAWDRMEEIFPDQGLVPLARGLLYEKTGQLEQAEVSYAQAREIGVWSDVTGQFAQIVLRAPVSHPAEVLLVECVSHQIEGKTEQALASCDRALSVDPGHFDSLWKRGQLYAQSGDWEAAAAAFSAAIEVDPDWPWVFYLRAQALIELGRADEAQADLAQALELEPLDELRQAIEALSTVP